MVFGRWLEQSVTSKPRTASMAFWMDADFRNNDDAAYKTMSGASAHRWDMASSGSTLQALSVEAVS